MSIFFINLRNLFYVIITIMSCGKRCRRNEDKTLFVGDAACAQFPNGAKDKKLARALADKIRSTGAVTCVEGHWQPVETEDTLRDLLS